MITRTEEFRGLTSDATRASAQAMVVLLFAALTAVGAQVVIPHDPVPFTLQTLVVLLAGGMLGKQNGPLSQGAYLLAGALGMPVFSSAGFGLARILGPTGGYLLAFPLAAGVVGLILANARPSLPRTFLAMVAGILLIFTLGTLQLYAVTPLSFDQSVASGFLIFSLWDIVKVGAATAIVYGWRRRNG